MSKINPLFSVIIIKLKSLRHLSTLDLNFQANPSFEFSVGGGCDPNSDKLKDSLRFALIQMNSMVLKPTLHLNFQLNPLNFKANLHLNFQEGALASIKMKGWAEFFQEFII